MGARAARREHRARRPEGRLRGALERADGAVAHRCRRRGRDRIGAQPRPHRGGPARRRHRPGRPPAGRGQRRGLERRDQRQRGLPGHEAGLRGRIPPLRPGEAAGGVHPPLLRRAAAGVGVPRHRRGADVRARDVPLGDRPGRRDRAGGRGARGRAARAGPAGAHGGAGRHGSRAEGAAP